VPIIGFERYRINIVTHKIVNSRGKEVKARLDSRGTLIVNLNDKTGKQRTVVMSKLVEKMHRSLLNKEEKEDTLTRVLMVYYNLYNDSFSSYTLQHKSKEVKKQIPDVDISEIGIILNRFEQRAYS